MFNSEIPNILQVSELIKNQFTKTFAKIDGLKHWFEDQPMVDSSKEGSDLKPDPSHSNTPSDTSINETLINSWINPM